jgi:dihydroorotate dehydrogenase electron transfer subunit
MKKIIQDVKVVSKTFLNPDHFVLELKSPGILPEMVPGQFAEVRIEGSRNVFLRRPLSIHDINETKNTFRFLVKIAGEGTRELSLLGRNDTLNVMYPLGKGFSLSDKGEVLLVGGGCGIAPLLFLARRLHEMGIQQKILLGARSKPDVFEVEIFENFGTVLITTDDGSLGEKGFITQHTIWKEAGKFNRIYCCGPEIMMKAVAGIAKEKGVDCEVSLENTMACGIGACLCCVTETVRGNECVCTAGPVFNINELKWQI